MDDEFPSLPAPMTTDYRYPRPLLQSDACPTKPLSRRVRVQRVETLLGAGRRKRWYLPGDLLADHTSWTG